MKPLSFLIILCLLSVSVSALEIRNYPIYRLPEQPLDNLTVIASYPIDITTPTSIEYDNYIIKVNNTLENAELKFPTQQFTILLSINEKAYLDLNQDTYLDTIILFEYIDALHPNRIGLSFTTYEFNLNKVKGTDIYGYSIYTVILIALCILMLYLILKPRRSRV